MKLIGLTLARNEAWSIEAVVRHSLRWCDEVIVLNHASTDDTGAKVRRLVGEYTHRLHLLEDSDPTWHEMTHRQRTLDYGRELGGTHFAICDADEMLTENLVCSIRGIVEQMQPGQILQLPWICCWRSLRQHRQDNSQWSRAMASLAFKDGPGVRWVTRNMGAVVGYDFHHRHAYGAETPYQPVKRTEGGILHFQHANWTRLRAKQVLYRMTELLRWPEFGVDAINRRYAGTSNEDGINLVDIPPAWFPPNIGDVRVDAQPWQLAEIKRLAQEHGRERFAGIDFLGIEP